MVKISVIIPVYNSEKYLEQCLDSVINQDFKDIEIICVNDGSTDGSLSVLQKYKQIKLIDKKNTGAGDSRNKGLEIASGEYILFLDSDDFLEPEALKTLYNKACLSNCDILFFNVFRYFEEDGQKNFYDYTESFRRRFQDNVFSPAEAKDVLFQTNALPFKMYKKDSLIKYNASYSTHFLVEDQKLFYTIVSNADRICAIQTPVLNYRIHTQSITTQVSKYIKDMFEEFYHCEEIIKKSKFNAELIDYFINDRIKAFFYWFGKVEKIKKPLFYMNLKELLKYIQKNYGQTLLQEHFYRNQILKILKYPYCLYRLSDNFQTTIKLFKIYLN